ncbi:MAG: hypothetical protein ABIR80_09610, partial [Opitutaceae bacterium]
TRRGEVTPSWDTHGCLTFPRDGGFRAEAGGVLLGQPPADAEINVLKSWDGGNSARGQDSAEFAHLAALKWETTCELGAVASSPAELDTAIRANPKIDVTAMLLAEARWFEPGLLGLCLFHRTWAGNVFLDFLAAHPKAEGQIGGLGAGLLYHLCEVSCRLRAPLLWGETAAGSTEFYERAFGIENVRDQLLVSLEQQRAYCRRMEGKWGGDD